MSPRRYIWGSSTKGVNPEKKSSTLQDWWRLGVRLTTLHGKKLNIQKPKRNCRIDIMMYRTEKRYKAYDIFLATLNVLTLRRARYLNQLK